MSKAKTASKPPKQPFHIPGEFVRFTFLRTYKAKTGVSDNEAETAFNLHLSTGRVFLAKQSGLCGDVPVYKFK